MLKDYYGKIEFNNIRIESSNLNNSNTSYFDPERFLSTDGTNINDDGDCLLSNCNPAGPVSYTHLTLPTICSV